MLSTYYKVGQVSERLGHPSIDMTAKRLSLHINKSMEENAINQYDEFLKSLGQIVSKHF